MLGGGRRAALLALGAGDPILCPRGGCRAAPRGARPRRPDTRGTSPEARQHLPGAADAVPAPTDPKQSALSSLRLRSRAFSRERSRAPASRARSGRPELGGQGIAAPARIRGTGARRGSDCCSWPPTATPKGSRGPPTPLAQDPRRAVAGAASSSVFLLRGLDHDDVARFVESACGFSAGSSALVQAIHAQTEGKPLLRRRGRPALARRGGVDARVRPAATRALERANPEGRARGRRAPARATLAAVQLRP